MNTDKFQEFITRKLQNELSSELTYHGIHHTMEVFNVCGQYIERMHIPEHNAYLLRSAALMHDTGYMNTFDNHEEESIRIAREILPNWNYSENEIEIICGIIRATKVPQKPTNLLEQIMGDSDLDYLGTDAFYKISETLYNELLAFNKISTHEEWDMLQVKFLQNHRYHTDFAKKYREPVKQKYLNELIDKLK
ncbi:MAG TPA: HD domain-containing protein [Draconibacterium sp.]|nr:HD domain-containing protein [Draconibacterium sp.]